ncbi:MAG: universal stress protein [Casimicrobiaceae bacterium]
MKILAAVDGSQHSTAMVEKLIARIGWFRELPEITLLHVHHPLPYKRAAAWAGKEAVHQYYEEESDAALLPGRAVLESAGVACTLDKQVGDPAIEIARVAEAGDFDLVAMGTHGHSGLTNLVMGSVATKVLASLKRPVLFLR